MWGPAKVVAGIAVAMVILGTGLILGPQQLGPIIQGSSTGSGTFVLPFSALAQPGSSPTPAENYQFTIIVYGKTANTTHRLGPFVLTGPDYSNLSSTLRAQYGPQVKSASIAPVSTLPASSPDLNNDDPNLVGCDPSGCIAIPHFAQLFQSTLGGDDPLLVGFYFFENNSPRGKHLLWHWGDNTSDETSSSLDTTRNHKYVLPCDKWSEERMVGNSIQFTALNALGQIQSGITLSDSNFSTLSALVGKNDKLAKETTIYNESVSHDTPNSNLQDVVEWLYGNNESQLLQHQSNQAGTAVSIGGTAHPRCIDKPDRKFHGMLEEFDSSNRIDFSQPFNITATKPKSYQMIGTLEQNEGVINQDDRAGFSVATKSNITSPYYTWIWGDGTYDGPKHSLSNPWHHYNAVGIYDGNLTVDSGNGSATSLSEMKNFSVMVVSNMRNTIFDIEVSSLASDPSHQKTKFRAGDPLWFNLMKVPYNPIPTQKSIIYSGVQQSVCQIWYSGWDFGDEDKPCNCNRDEGEVCHRYNQSGTFNVKYQTYSYEYNKTLMWNKTLTITPPPTIALSDSKGKVGTKVTVEGSNFSPLRMIFFYWCVDINCAPSNDYVLVNGTGAFARTLTVPAGPGSYTLSAQSALREDVAYADFEVTR